MFQSIVSRIRKRSSFVLTEVITASVIVVLIFFGLWSVYNVTWQWWHETAPVIEAQRIARIAVSASIDGSIDSTAGFDSSYKRRNGIAWAVYEPAITTPTANAVEFGLEKEKETFQDYPAPHNVRSFYLGVDANSGLNILIYKDNASVTHPIQSTLGLTDLKFEKFKEDDKVRIKVTATVEKDIMGTRQTPYHIKVVYADTVYLRNVR